MSRVKHKIDESGKLTTKEAIELIKMLKEKVNSETIKFPSLGEKIEFDVLAIKDSTKFIININRGAIDKQKCTYQGRTYVNNIPLLRLDVATNACHINPDGTKIIGTHLHIYDEENNLSNAIPFDIDNPDLYKYCLIFFNKFNILKDSYNIDYVDEL